MPTPGIPPNENIPPISEAHAAYVPWLSYVHERFGISEHAVEVALAQVQEALQKTELLQVERVDAVRREVKTALDAANIAILKSDAAAEKRFATIDELRDQIRMADDRAMNRTDAEQEFAIIRKNLEGLENVKANEQLQQERMESLRREASALNVANSAAIAKSDAAAEKRFESVNEFRAQLQAQAERFIPREVVEAQALEFRSALSTINSRLDQSSGATANSSRMTTIAIAIMGLVITVVVFAANMAFR